MLRKLTLGLLLGFGLCSLPASASPVPFYVGQGPAQPFRCFEDDHGGFYLVWVTGPSGKVFTLVSQHLDPDGRSLWPEQGLVISSQAASAEDWSGLADGQGGLTLYWDEADGVHAQRFSAGGERLRPGNSVRISSSTAIQPDAVADAVGGTLIVWREPVAGEPRTVIMAQRIDLAGRRLWIPGVRVSLRASHQTNPRAVYDDMSGMIVAWRDEANQASELRVQRIDFQGNRLWTLEGLKITAPVGASEFPTMAPAGDGSVVMAWTAQSNQKNQILLQKVGPDPVLQWGISTYASNAPATNNQWNPVILGDAGGGAWVAWEDFRNRQNYQVELNHLTGAGTSLWATGEVAAAPAQGDQGKTAMVGNGIGGVWLAWIDNRLATVGLYVQEIDAKGTRLLSSSGRRVADQLSKPSRPQLVLLKPGKAAIVWSDRPKKDQWALFWTLVDTP